MATRLVEPYQTYLDSNNDPLNGGLLYFYETGTTTPKNTYSNSTLATTNANPVVLNSAGRVAGDVWGEGEYKLVVKNSAGTTQATYDPLRGVSTDGRLSITSKANMSALLSANLTAGQYIDVDYRTTAGDGGGGVFRVTKSDISTEVTADSLGGIYVPFDSDASGASGGFIREYQKEVDVRWFGALGDNSTDDTTALQAAIDYVNSTFTANGSSTNGGGGGVLFVPAGRYKFSTLTLKPGVSIHGEGRYKTTFLCTNNGSIGFKNASAASQAAADIVSFCEYKDFALRYDNGTTFNSNTVLWDMTGFTRCIFTNISLFIKDYITGMKLTGATLAGSGGPQHWYNNFYGCDWLILATGSGTGIGCELGDSLVTKEQITSWHFFGCKWRATGAVGGTGLKINSATGCTFNGVNFEGLTTGAIVGTASGTRGTQDVIFNGIYGESCTTGFDIKATSNDTLICNMFATSFTISDAGSQTRIFSKHDYEFPLQSGGTFEIKQENSGTRPLVSGQYPGWSLSDDTGGNVVFIRNGGQVDETGNAFQVANDATYLIKAGTDTFTINATRFYMNGSTSVFDAVGTGTPEGNLAGGVGSTFRRTDGGTGSSFYVKETGGVGNTGWVAK